MFGQFRDPITATIARLFYLVRYVPAVGQFLCIYLAHARGHTLDAGVLDGKRTHVGLSRSPDLGSHTLRQLQVLTQRLIVVPGNKFIPAQRLNELFHLRDDRKPHHGKRVRAEVRHLVGNV